MSVPERRTPGTRPEPGSGSQEFGEPPPYPSHDVRHPAHAGATEPSVWLSGSMTVLVTRRHVDYVRVTTTGCHAAS